MNLIRTAQQLLSIHEDLPFRLPKGVSVDEYEMYDFEQVWGSTALGFGGIGGQAMTSARTFVFISPYHKTCYVYFAGRFAYEVPYSQILIDDIMKQNVASVTSKGKYLK